MSNVSKKPSVIDKLYKCKGWKVENTLTEIDNYFYSIQMNHEQLQNFINNTQNYESYENRELDKEFFRLLSNFCGAITSYYNQRKHWLEKRRPKIKDCREFDFIMALRNTIVHNRIPHNTACHFTAKGVFVTRTINRKEYTDYFQEHLIDTEKSHIKKSFGEAIKVLDLYTEDEIEIATECKKCYAKFQEYHEKLTKEYKSQNADALEELGNIWDEITKGPLQP